MFQHSLHKLAIGLLGVTTLGLLVVFSLTPVKADNPTFFFSNSSGCGSAVSTLTATTADSLTLYVCIDGDNEGAGFLGAETHISYPTSLASVSNIQCNAFDTCIDLSEYGAVKLLAASGPLPDGQAVTTQRPLGSFALSFESVGTPALNFGLAKVINENQEVENRSGIGITIDVVEGEEVPVVEEIVEEEPVEEEPPAEETPDTLLVGLDEPIGDEDTFFDEKVEEPAEEEEPVAPEDTAISSIVISPVSFTAEPGDIVQVVTTANYTGGRASENITSCFPCPTPNNSANGTTTYSIVSGPGSFTGSKVAVGDYAVPGQVISFNAGYTDNTSGTSGLSGNSSITVVAEVEKPVEEEPVEKVDESVKDEETETGESMPTGRQATEGGEGEGEEEVTAEEVSDTIDKASDEQVKSDAKIAEVEAEGGEAGVHEVAPPNYKEEAETALAEQDPQEHSDVEIPTTTQVEESYDACSLSSSNTVDSDQDGLSDRTECYLNTDQNNPDSDSDGCWDGDEINRFYSNPLTSADCNIKEIVERKVIIVDPKPNWIVKTFDISGTAPTRSQRVGITAFPATHTALNAVIDEIGGLNVVLQSGVAEEAEVDFILSELEAYLQGLNDFLGKYAQEYGSLMSMTSKIADYMAKGAVEVIAAPEDAQALLDELMNHQTQAVFLGEVTELQEVGAGQSVMAGFHLVPKNILEDTVYDLIATAQLDDGSILSSPAVRVILDSTVVVTVPTPQSLDGLPIFGVSEAIEVESGRPVLSGQSNYGAQIFATWESLVLASSIIADSSAGGFDIQSPRELEREQGHTVTVFAVSKQAAGMVRSESVTVDFAVTKEGSNYLLWIGIILALIILAGFVAEKRTIKIDHIAPEHRAKENELYKAFELEKPHEEEVPEDHSDKQEEVEKAFAGGLEVDVETEAPADQPPSEEELPDASEGKKQESS